MCCMAGPISSDGKMWQTSYPGFDIFSVSEEGDISVLEQGCQYLEESQRYLEMENTTPEIPQYSLKRPYKRSDWKGESFGFFSLIKEI